MRTIKINNCNAHTSSTNREHHASARALCSTTAVSILSTLSQLVSPHFAVNSQTFRRAENILEHCPPVAYPSACSKTLPLFTLFHQTCLTPHLIQLSLMGALTLRFPRFLRAERRLSVCIARIFSCSKWMGYDLVHYPPQCNFVTLTLV